MEAGFLLPESVAHQDGKGAEIELKTGHSTWLLTLGVTRILEQENLEVSIWGSGDREHWRQLLVFPQKSYCGTYSMLLDLSRQRDIRYVRAEWKMHRWERSERMPLFEFYLSAEPTRVLRVGAG